MKQRFKDKVEKLFFKGILNFKEASAIMGISEVEARHLFDFLEKIGYLKTINIFPRKVEILKKKLNEEDYLIIENAVKNNLIEIIKNEVLGAEGVSISAVQRCLLYGYPLASDFIEFLNQEKFITKKEDDQKYKVITADFNKDDYLQWLSLIKKKYK